MKIENSNIKNPVSVYNSNSGVKQTTQAANAVSSSAPSLVKSDKLELSEKAKSYSQISEKIKNGEYDKPEIIDAVARKLSKYL